MRTFVAPDFEMVQSAASSLRAIHGRWATGPGRFARRLDVVTEAAKLDRLRLLCWILAWTGLSAACFIGDGDPMAEIDLHIARLAAAEIDRMS